MAGNYDPACLECKGTGERDSGGTHPWGAPALLRCDCDQPKTKINWHAGLTGNPDGTLTRWKSDGKGGLVEATDFARQILVEDAIIMDRLKEND
ncbi:hypothetical protein EVB78_161 [Rhizobium phage RHph_N1_15]|nr:hypothetical protein EVB77_161 [Rhizobium phage RHph_N1_10]QIG69363.1 hypothetical protein EVB78_161 [Rhizobium phage RHph_N1_15]QIG75223.1 hypothetical protein EVC15_161 [Rhizobium phage RHph_N2_6]